MFQPALKRLFLILFPVILFVTALYLSHIYPPSQVSAPPQNTTKECPFYLGVSFFSQKQKNIKPRELSSYTLSEVTFIKKIQDLKLDFHKKNISLEHIFFALPLTLTKEEIWIASQKTFFILPSGERKQISHLTYSEITENQNYKALKLDKILSLLPKKSNFLFYLLGTNRKKILENLNKISNQVQGDLYLSSSNEKLLKDLLLYQSCSNSNNLTECLSNSSTRIALPAENLKQPLKTNIKILRSFKTLIQLEMLSILPKSFKHIKGQGIIVPNGLSPSLEISSFLQQANKFLFFEKDPPYTDEDINWIKKSQALISSQMKLAIRSIKDKKTCLAKN